MKTHALKILAVLTLMMMPSFGFAQNRPQQAGPGGGGGGGGAGGGMAGAQVGPLVQVIKQLNLTDDQQAKVKEIMQQTQSDLRDAMSGMQDATPQERQQKMQDMQKIVTDTRGKIEDVLTPDQKTKYYPLMAKAVVTTAEQRLKLLKAAAAKQELTEDEKTQMTKLLDDDQKTLDGLSTDADGVKDADGLADLQKKAETAQQDTRKQIVEILGPEGAQSLMQAMRPNAGGRFRQGGAGANGGATTKPAQN